MGLHLYTELLYAIFPTLSPCFAIPTYHLTFLSCLCHLFVSSRCMLELKFAIYHKAAEFVFTGFLSMQCGRRITDLSISSTTQTMRIDKASSPYPCTQTNSVILLYYHILHVRAIPTYRVYRLYDEKV